MREPWAPSLAHEAWSRRWNGRLWGSPDEMICSRAWRWRLLVLPLVVVIDVYCWLGPRRFWADGHRWHCRRMYLRESRRWKAEEARRWSGL